MGNFTDCPIGAISAKKIQSRFSVFQIEIIFIEDQEKANQLSARLLHQESIRCIARTQQCFKLKGLLQQTKYRFQGQALFDLPDPSCSPFKVACQGLIYESEQDNQVQSPFLFALKAIKLFKGQFCAWVFKSQQEKKELLAAQNLDYLLYLLHFRFSLLAAVEQNYYPEENVHPGGLTLPQRRKPVRHQEMILPLLNDLGSRKLIVKFDLAPVFEFQQLSKQQYVLLIVLEVIFRVSQEQLNELKQSLKENTLRRIAKLAHLLPNKLHHEHIRWAKLLTHVKECTLYKRWHVSCIICTTCLDALSLSTPPLQLKKPSVANDYNQDESLNKLQSNYFDSSLSIIVQSFICLKNKDPAQSSFCRTAQIVKKRPQALAIRDLSSMRWRVSVTCVREIISCIVLMRWLVRLMMLSAYLERELCG